MKSVFLVVLLGCILSLTAFGQATTGSLSGNVKDPNGAIVVGASVTLKSVGTGIEQRTTTNDQGGFIFPSAQPGLYAVTVESAGFKRAIASEVKIEVSKETQLALTLEVGVASETVTVSSAQEVVNTSSPTLTNVINTKQVVDLPISSRNPLDLAALQAGIAVIGTDTRGSSVGGLRQTATNVTQDGINAMDNFVKTSSFFALSAPSLGSTDEFSITTGTVGSDAGRGVAQVNVVTKGGTNEYHGSLFYLTRNSAFNANDFFSNSSGSRPDGSKVSPRTDLHQHFYGFTIGGPAYLPRFGEGGPRIFDGHNKAFFFFSYEGFREKFQVTRNRTVLTPEARMGIFRYTGAAGTQGAGVLQTVNLLAIGNVRALNPLTLAQLNAMPTPNNTLVGDSFNTAGAQFNVVGSDPSDKYVARYDHQLVENTRLGSHKLELVYNRAKFSLFPDTFNGIEAPFPGGANAGQSSIRSLATGAVHSTFGNATNTVRYGRQWAPVAFLREASPTAPFTVLASVSNFDNTFLSQGRETTVNQITDNFALPKGSHTIRIGADYQKVFADTFNDTGINPTVTIGTNSSNPDGIASTSLPFSTTAIQTRARSIYADLVGNLASANAVFNVTSPTSGFVPGATRSRIFQQRDLALFAQDQWRVKSNLTFNYGVRWEFEGVPTIPNGLAIQTNPDSVFGVSGRGNLFNPTAAAGPPPAVATLDFVSGNTGKGLYNNDWNNFAPFVGLAYSPNFKSGILHGLFGNSSAIRAGYSISYLHDGFTVISNALGTGLTNPGLIQTAANTTPTGVLTSAGVALTTPVFTIPITDKQNFDLNPGNGLWAIERNLRIPYVQQWSFGFEREIFKDTAIEIRYVGNHALKVWRAVDFNEVNIFENGFLQEFLRGQGNLSANEAAFAAGDVTRRFCPGVVVGQACQTSATNTTAVARIPTFAFFGAGTSTSALPILNNFFTGIVQTNTFASSTFVSNLQNNNVGALASTLAFSNTYKANRQNAALGIPANFFVANPNAAFARLLGNDSTSNYHSLQVEFRRRFSQGLQFQADYTYSKSLNDAAGAAGNNQSDLVNFRTLRNKGLDYVRSNQDQTHRFVANGIYELPFGKGKSFFNGAPGVVNQIVGGWTVGTIVSWQGRPPFFVAAGRSTFNSFNTGNNPAQLIGISFEDFKKNLGVFKTPAGVFFINPAILDITTNATTGRYQGSTLKAGLLGTPAPGSFGNFPLNSLNGPAYFNLDMSVVKRFKVGERVKLELKTTFINALNHPNYVYSTQNFDSATFGLINTQSGNARIIHFTGTMNF